MSVALLVFKNTGQVVMCEVNPVTETEKFTRITDYVEIRFVQKDEKTMMPIPVVFPDPSLDGLLTCVGKKKELTINKDDVYYYSECDIADGTISFYRKLMGKIDIAKTIPHQFRELLKG
jgi:hypothetical protein